MSREWSLTGPTDVDTASIVPNALPNGATGVDAELDALGGSVNATPWDQVREADVGGLTAIVDANTSDALWSITQPRDPGHRLSEVQVDSATFAIEHDAAGRLTDGLIFDYTYDPNNRLVAASDHEFYVYTADGDLAAVLRRNGAETRFAYDGAQMIAAYDETATPLWEATWGDGIDQLVEFRDFAAAGPVVPLVDHRNSPVATYNPTTVAIEQLARWDVHGRLTLLDANEALLCAEQGTPRLVCNAPSALPFAFNGRWRSPITGLVNMRARWYSPRLGQFTAPDPLGYVDLWSLYGFAAFDSVNSWDPSGLAECSLWGGCIQQKLGESKLQDEDLGRRPDPNLLEGMREGFGAIKTAAEISATVSTLPLGGLEDLAIAAGAKALARLAPHLPKVRAAKKLGDDLLQSAKRVLGKVPCAKSFSAGTPVLACNGELIPIEELRVGDMVWAQSEDGLDASCMPVQFVHQRTAPEVLVLSLRTPDGRIDEVEVTAEHPVFVLGRGWTDIAEVGVGELLVSAAGDPVEVVSLMRTDATTVYNLTIREYPTFFVGESEVWVHNCFPFQTLRGKSHKYLRKNKPKGWREVPADNRKGWKWLDENGVERFRFMRPQKGGVQWQRERNGYMRWMNEKGEFLDVDGNVVPRDMANDAFQDLTHIPYEGIWP